MPPLDLAAEASLPVFGQPMRIRAYEQARNGSAPEVAVVLIHPETGVYGRPLVRVHSQCLTGDTLGSSRCDCGAQLRASLNAISNEPSGLLIYLPSHEGRGIGLVNKIRAYALQDEEGLDTVDANLALRLPVDERRYDIAIAVLEDLGVRRLRLLTNNPSKLVALRAAGLALERVPMPAFVTEDNREYLTVKRDVMGHALPQRLGPERLDGDGNGNGHHLPAAVHRVLHGVTEQRRASSGRREA